MLDNLPANIRAIATATRQFHRTGVIPPPLPQGVTISQVNTSLTIQYGFGQIGKGNIVMQRGQFEITEVSKNGDLVPLASYNHEGVNDTAQKYIDALKCLDLNNNQTYASAIIILSSECARSEMVLDATLSLMNVMYAPYPPDAWAGLEFAFKNYSAVCAFKGYNIQAGNALWQPLIGEDYIAYLNHQIDIHANGDWATYRGQIEAVMNYIESYPV